MLWICIYRTYSYTGPQAALGNLHNDVFCWGADGDSSMSSNMEM